MLLKDPQSIKDTIVIIPAFNEEKSIGLVLKDLPMRRIQEVIVINNASTDKTEEVARMNGALVVYEPIRGYGQACLAGIEQARSYNPKYLIFLDGDYSDYPEDIDLLFEKLDKGFEFVLGSRMTLGESRSSLLPQAKFGNQLAAVLTKLLFGGTKFSDLGPFRGITLEALERIQMQDQNFGWTIEMQIKAIIHKLKYVEVPVRYRKRVGVSKITGTFRGTISAGYKIIYIIFKYRITSHIYVK